MVRKGKAPSQKKKKRVSSKNVKTPVNKSSKQNEKHIKIINMSSESLSKSQIRLLCKGLKFTPTPISNQPELEKDVDEFCRKLRLKEFFYQEQSEENDSRDESLVRNKSSFHPNRNRDRTLDTCVDSLQKLQNIQWHSVHTQQRKT